MKKLKRYKGYFLSILLILLVLVLGLLFSWKQIQFKRYCQDKEVCACASKKLTSQSKQVFVKLAQYMKKTGKSTVDAMVLKEIPAEEMLELGLTMKFCTADVARQKMLDNIMSSKGQFPGDYYCMREVLMHGLSNEEILFLQSPQSKDIEALKDPVIRQMYIDTSSRLMKCMNPDIQKQYQEELKKLSGSSKKKK